MRWFGRKRAKGDDVVIDLREPAPAPKLVWGAPTPCPDCDGRGYLDHIDLHREVMYIHCVVCGLRYEVAKADIDAQARQLT